MVYLATAISIVVVLAVPLYFIWALSGDNYHPDDFENPNNWL